MRIYTGLMLLLTACGQNQGGGSENETSLVAQGEQEQPADEQQPKQYAELVDNAAALAACDATTEGRIAYVKADATLQACAAGAWSVIDLKGAAGAAGVVGEKGDKGDKGDVGEAGGDGERGPEGSATAWLDPSTGKRWMKGSNGNYVTAKAACTGDFFLATGDELHQAALHGLMAGLSGASTGWAGPDTGSNNQTLVSSMAANPVLGADTVGATHGIYCIEAP